MAKRGDGANHVGGTGPSGEEAGSAEREIPAGGTPSKTDGMAKSPRGGALREERRALDGEDDGEPEVELEIEVSDEPGPDDRGEGLVRRDRGRENLH